MSIHVLHIDNGVFINLKSIIYTLFNAQFDPEGLKAYTRNIYKQRTQVK
jgi:hypothetical protein